MILYVDCLTWTLDNTTFPIFNNHGIDFLYYKGVFNQLLSQVIPVHSLLQVSHNHLPPQSQEQHQP